MSSAALLDQDFGSESEGDNFKPAPAEDSDNDAAGDSDVEEFPVGQVNGNKDSGHEQRASDEEKDTTRPAGSNGLIERIADGHGMQDYKGGGNTGSERRNMGGLDGAGDDDDGDVEDEVEEDEEEDDDDEDAISVGPRL